MQHESRITTALETLDALTRGERTPAGREYSPHFEAAHRERRRILRDCQARLTGRQAMVLILLYERGLPQTEAAAEIGISQQALSKMHERIRRILRRELAGRGIFELRQIL